MQQRATHTLMHSDCLKLSVVECFSPHINQESMVNCKVKPERWDVSSNHPHLVWIETQPNLFCFASLIFIVICCLHFYASCTCTLANRCKHTNKHKFNYGSDVSTDALVICCASCFPEKSPGDMEPRLSGNGPNEHMELFTYNTSVCVCVCASVYM